MTLEDLGDKLPNGFHDARIFLLELDYKTGIARFHMSLVVGWPEDPEPERQAYQDATLVVGGLSFCSVDPPCSTERFLPDGEGIWVSGDPAKSDNLPSLPDLAARCPIGTDFQIVVACGSFRTDWLIGGQCALFNSRDSYFNSRRSVHDCANPDAGPCVERAGESHHRHRHRRRY